MLRLEHIGIAVEDAEAMTRVISDVLGQTPYKAELVASEGVRTLFLNVGGAKLELLEATSEDSPIAGFLSKRGAGMHHLAFEVADLDAEISRLGSLGYQVLGDARPGADGKRIVFLHPRGTGRVLMELCQQVEFPRIGGEPAGGGESASGGGQHADEGGEPGRSALTPEFSILVTESDCAGALGHALARHFRVQSSASDGQVGVISAQGPQESPLVRIRNCAAGDLDILISANPAPESNRPAPGPPSLTSIPSYLWLGLPDPWGFLGDLVAAHVQGSRSAPKRIA